MPSLRTLLTALAWVVTSASPGLAQDSAPPEADTIAVPGFSLPRYSDFLSDETRRGLERRDALETRARAICNPFELTASRDIRACEARYFRPIISEARQIYDVRIDAARLGRVQTDIVTPSEGVPWTNANRVLINVHGGGFTHGARFGGQLEAMPLAGIGKYKVVTIDYRMAPDYHYPAGSDDVVAVYRELLDHYPPANIGIYGCSGGARIVGQAIAQINHQGFPRPGAIALLCSAPVRFGGDSNTIAMALYNLPPRTRDFTRGYFQSVDPNDPLAFPGEFDSEAAQFPPTLLIGSTRDYSMSPMLAMHSRLVRLSVPAELHVFEGLGHGEFVRNFYIPESRQAAEVMSRFFTTRLGGSPKTN